MCYFAFKPENVVWIVCRKQGIEMENWWDIPRNRNVFLLLCYWLQTIGFDDGFPLLSQLSLNQLPHNTHTEEQNITQLFQTQHRWISLITWSLVKLIHDQSLTVAVVPSLFYWNQLFSQQNPHTQTEVNLKAPATAPFTVRWLWVP